MRKSFQFTIKIFQKNNGILRTSQAIKKGIDPKIMYEMVEAGILLIYHTITLVLLRA